MTTRRPIRANGLIAALAAGITACGSGAGTVAYVGGELWDGIGGPVVHDAVIVVSNGHVAAAGPPDLVSVPRGADVVRLDGRWVIPGLVDGHAHVARWTLSRFLAYGVTAVRDAGGDADSVVALRDELSLGSTLGPRLYIAGPMIDGTPATYPTAVAVRTAADARRAVDRLVLLEVDYAEVYSKITRPLLVAIADEAGTLHLPIAAHLGKVDALTASQLGVHSLEHMTGVVEATVRDPRSFYRAHDSFFAGWNRVERAWASLDSASLERTARTLVERGVVIVPTLALREALTHLSDPEYQAQLDLSGVPAAVRTAWNLPDLVRRGGFDRSTVRAERASRPAQNRFVRIYRRLGGIVVAGSDAPNQLLAPGASLHDELGQLVAAGLTPREALLAATRDAARLLGADSIGRIAPGTVADFVVLQGDPLADIENVRRVESVIVRGRAHPVSELNAGWHGGGSGEGGGG